MPRYLLITSKTIHVPGDERSRTHPGHGYPAYDEVVEVNKFFDTEQALIEHLTIWKPELKDPLIYEIGERVKLTTTTTLSLNKA